jgi:hypothetical protein
MCCCCVCVYGGGGGAGLVAWAALLANLAPSALLAAWAPPAAPPAAGQGPASVAGAARPLGQHLRALPQPPPSKAQTRRPPPPPPRRRYFAIHASPALARLRDALGADLQQFESAALGTRINRRLYQEAEALYSRCARVGGGGEGGRGGRGAAAPGPPRQAVPGRLGRGRRRRCWRLLPHSGADPPTAVQLGKRGAAVPGDWRCACCRRWAALTAAPPRPTPPEGSCRWFWSTWRPAAPRAWPSPALASAAAWPRR